MKAIQFSGDTYRQIDSSPDDGSGQPLVLQVLPDWSDNLKLPTPLSAQSPDGQKLSASQQETESPHASNRLFSVAELNEILQEAVAVAGREETQKMQLRTQQALETIDRDVGHRSIDVNTVERAVWQLAGIIEYTGNTEVLMQKATEIIVARGKVIDRQIEKRRELGLPDNASHAQVVAESQNIEVVSEFMSQLPERLSESLGNGATTVCDDNYRIELPEETLIDFKGGKLKRFWNSLKLGIIMRLELRMSLVGQYNLELELCESPAINRALKGIEAAGLVPRFYREIVGTEGKNYLVADLPGIE